MGLIQARLEVSALRREMSDLGGTIRFYKADGTLTDDVPCAMGVDFSGLQRADNSAGLQLNKTRRVIIRKRLLDDLENPPQAGDKVVIQSRLETDPVEMVITPGTGIEQMNGIFTALNLYNPNA